MNKPNIILLTIDTLRADILGCYGRSPSMTPNIDRLAASGVRFDQAITGGSWTQAAFPVMLTSSYAAMFGGCLGRLSAERPSPIESLSAHGYMTGAFSTNLHLSRATGYDRGFQHFTELMPHETDPRLRRIKGGQRLLRNPLTHSVLRPMGVSMRPARLYSSAAEVTDRICSWIGQVEAPFFVWAHYMDMHWPYHLEETLMRPGEIAQAWRDLAIMHGRSNFDRDKSITSAQRDHFIEMYEKSLHYLDAQIGRLLRQLEKSGLDANTLVIVVSDHGEEFLDHGRWGHWESNLYDEIIRVPLIMRIPNQPGGQVIRQQVSLMGLMPTILELCDTPFPDGLMGSSLAPLWTGGGVGYDQAEAICEMQRDLWQRIAVRTEALKYIWDSKQPYQPALYDLRLDPGEKQNVIERYPQEARRFQATVNAHLDLVAATNPQTPAPALQLDESISQRLRDLGYL